MRLFGYSVRLEGVAGPWSERPGGCSAGVEGPSRSRVRKGWGRGRGSRPCSAGARGEGEDAAEADVTASVELGRDVPAAALASSVPPRAGAFFSLPPRRSPRRVQPARARVRP